MGLKKDWSKLQQITFVKKPIIVEKNPDGDLVGKFRVIDYEKIGLEKRKKNRNIIRTF